MIETTFQAYFGYERCSHCWRTGAWKVIDPDGWVDYECTEHLYMWWAAELPAVFWL